MLPVAAFQHLSLKQLMGLFWITYQVKLHQQQQQQQRMPEWHPLSSKGMFFFVTLFIIHQLMPTQRKETTTSPKEPKRHV